MDLKSTTEKAKEAADALRAAPAGIRIARLDRIADSLERAAEELIDIAYSETQLDANRLRGEVARTAGQLRLFAKVIADGAYLEVVIDHGPRGAVPSPPDLRRMLQPIGAVAVFAASNFPFAFSVAGGDTASALAAGCSVVVKVHPGHPLTSKRTAEIVAEALEETGAPSGTFSVVEGLEQGLDLARDPAISAVAFTGSLRAGRIIHDVCASRDDPIPFFGELGSLNPVVVTPSADAERGAELAAGLAGSFTLGVGQYCTKPGLVFVPEGSALESHLRDLVDLPPRPLLNATIAEAYRSSLRRVMNEPEVELVGGASECDETLASPTVLAVDAAAVGAKRDILLDEVFGPVTLLVRYTSLSEVVALLSEVGGSLTATIHAEDSETIDQLVNIAREIAGRILFQGWPTGVAVTWAQNHGGPWPATTTNHTSVGASAIQRFLRPIVFQDAPARVLPPELREDNPLNIPRRVDGKLQVRANDFSESEDDRSRNRPSQ